MIVKTARIALRTAFHIGQRLMSMELRKEARLVLPHALVDPGQEELPPDLLDQRSAGLQHAVAKLWEKQAPWKHELDTLQMQGVLLEEEDDLRREQEDDNENVEEFALPPEMAERLGQLTAKVNDLTKKIEELDEQQQKLSYMVRHDSADLVQLIKWCCSRQPKSVMLQSRWQKL